MLVLLQTALVLALVATAGYGIWEVRRWGTPAGREMVSPRQRRLRVWGLFFLLAALGLWLRGTSIPLPPPQHKRAAAHYLGYWMVTVLAALPLIPLALLDARENMRRALEDRRRLRESILAGSGRDQP